MGICNGLMVLAIQASGVGTMPVVMASLSTYQVMFIKDNGGTIRLMGTEFTRARMEVSTKGIGLMTLRMAKDEKFGRMEATSKGIIIKDLKKVMGCINGQMVRTTKAIGTKMS